MLKLEKAPRSNDVHHVADYAELLCLANQDGLLTQADFVERLRERRDLGENEDPAAPTRAEVGDARVRRAGDVFRTIRYRAGAFGDAYPFTMPTPSTIERKANVESRHRDYLFLLLASSLGRLPVTRRDELTTALERTTYFVVQAWLPPVWEVHPFGTVGIGTRFTGELIDRVTELAGAVHERLLVDANWFRDGDFGDGGVDVVAWWPYDNDPNGGLTVFLVQSTCLEKWRPKQYESGYDRWKRVIAFAVRTGNVLIIPYCPRRPDGMWDRDGWVESATVIDRLRMMSFGVALVRTETGAGHLLDEVLAYREPTV